MKLTPSGRTRSAAYSNAFYSYLLLIIPWYHNQMIQTHGLPRISRAGVCPLPNLPLSLRIEKRPSSPKERERLTLKKVTVTRNKVGAPGLQAVPSTRTHTLVLRAHSLAKLGAGGDPSEDRRSVTTVLALLDALDRIRRTECPKRLCEHA